MTEHGGFVLGSPLGITTRAARDIALKCAGFAAPCGGTNPDFTQLPNDWAAFPGGETPILAMSLGIDVFHVWATSYSSIDGVAGAVEVAELIIPPGGWLALNFAVESAGLATATAPAILNAQAAGIADSTVFNYLVPRSDVVGEPEGNSTVVGLMAADLGIGSSDDIEGLNMHMALYDTELVGTGSSFFTGLLAIPPEDDVFVYFTLRPEFVRAAGGGSVGWPDLPKDGAVFRSRWNPDTGNWELPALFRDIPQGGIITGLAMRVSEELEEIMFSTRNEPAEMQLEYVSFEVGGGIKTPRRRVSVRDDAGRHSAGRLVGAGRGIGDFCTQDPWNGVTIAGTSPIAVLDDFVIARRLQSPLFGFGIDEYKLSVSGFRHATHRVLFRTCMNFMDWPEGEGQALLAWFLLRDYGTSPGSVLPPPPFTPPSDAWELLHVDTFPYAGGPVHRDYPFPGPAADGPLVWRYAMAAQWVVIRDGTLHIGPVSVLRAG